MKDEKLGCVWLSLLVLLAFIIFLFARCSSTKDIVKTDTNTTSQWIKDLQDSVRVYKADRDRFESEIRELQYSGITFIRDTINSHDTITNTVEITKEGAIKASGNISSAYVSKSLIAKVIAEKERIIDSLKSVKQQEKYITKTITVTKDKHTKTTFFSLWLLLIAFIAGWIVRAKIGSTSFSLFNKKITL